MDSYDILENVKHGYDQLDVSIAVCRKRIRYMQRIGEWDDNDPKCISLIGFLLGLRRAREVIKNEVKVA